MRFHIGDAGPWTAVDPLVIIAALALFAAAAAAIWAPVVRSRRAWRRLARVAMVATMLVAIFPSVAPYDHLLPAEAHADTTETHTAHCHTTPGSCSDAPVSAGAGQFLMSDALVAVPALSAIAILLAIPMLVGVSSRPNLRPPLAAT